MLLLLLQQLLRPLACCYDFLQHRHVSSIGRRVVDCSAVGGGGTINSGQASHVSRARPVDPHQATAGLTEDRERRSWQAEHIGRHGALSNNALSSSSCSARTAVVVIESSDTVGGYINNVGGTVCRRPSTQQRQQRRQFKCSTNKRPGHLRKASANDNNSSSNNNNNNNYNNNSRNNR